MLYPTTRIQFMDVNSEEVTTCSVDAFFRKYFHKSEQYHAIRRINFERDGMIVKIRDNEGWTDIRYIDMYNNDDGWVVMHAADKTITVSPFTFIPTYDEEHPETGFHGEIKYPYILMHPEKVHENKAKVRVIKGHDGRKDVEFAHGIILPNDSFLSKIATFVIGYNIVTKSRFFNAEGVYLFGDEELTLEEYNKWYPQSDDKKS